MAHDDEAYFRRRVEQELTLAQRAVDSAVVHAQYRLAEAYLDKLEPVELDVDRTRANDADKPLFDFTQSRAGT